jgi:hypothetical protein
MAILDALSSTYAFDQRLFNLYNPSGRPASDFAWPNPIYQSFLGFAYTPDSSYLGSTRTKYWRFLGDFPFITDDDGRSVEIVGVWADASTVNQDYLANIGSNNPNDDQMLWRLTGGGRNIFQLSDAAKSSDNADDTLFLTLALAFDDTFNLSGLNDYAIGFGGNDTMNGGGDNDTLVGHLGADVLRGGTGNDVFLYEHASHSTLSNLDTIADYELGDAIELRLSMGLSAAIALYQGTVADTVSYILSSSPTNTIYYFVNDTDRYVYVKGVGSGVSFNGTLIKINSNDTAVRVIGGDGREFLFDREGVDTVSGGAVIDTFYESLGNDLFEVNNVNDRVVLNVSNGSLQGGIDTIEANSSYDLNSSDAQIENLTLKGNSPNEATGNGLDNNIVGNASNNLLNGLAGKDTLSGGDGNDTLEGGLGADVLRGGAGRDVFRISSPSDSLLDRSNEIIAHDTILDYNFYEDSIEFVGMRGIDLVFATETMGLFSIETLGKSKAYYQTVIDFIIPGYHDAKVVFFAADSNGSEGIYLYVNGSGSGTDYDGSLLRYSIAQSGVTIDGYLSNALVWIDTDNNGVRDWTDANGNGRFDGGEGESWTLTDGQGRYSGLEGSGTLRVSANPNGTTIDISTGAVFTGSYAAPSDSRVISPLTTLLVASGDQQAIKDAFVLDDIDLTSFDPLTAATAANAYNDAAAAAAIQMQGVNAQIANIFAVATGMMTAAGASASSASTIANAIAQNLVAAAAAGPVDLTSAAVISTAIAAGAVGVLTDGQRVAFTAQLPAVSSAMAEINGQIQALSDTVLNDAANNIEVDVTAVLRSVIAAQIVAQETLVTQARNAVLNNNGALVTINAGNISQLMTDAATEVGQILTPGASHRYAGSIDDIQAAGLSADGSMLVLKFDSNEVVFLSVESTGFSLAGVGYTPQQIIDQFTLRPAFTYFVNNATAYLLPDLFAGDASLGLLYQWIDTSADAVLVGSNFADFIVLQGTGNKAVNSSGGADVIDGGTGSTFVSGGVAGDADTFFLDGRGSGVSWSTITDFELGRDKATIWGWRAGVSKASVLFNDTDTGGAAGYTGLTLHFENLLPDAAANGSLNANFNSITLSGLTLAQFGASSLTELNDQIANNSNSHFIVDQTTDVYGDHGYLYIS